MSNEAKIVQIRRGTATEHQDFIGDIGELTMDTDNKTIRVHDGETVGGTALAREQDIPDLSDADYVIAWQMPTAENNYTWYRKYKSGWVEQGGRTNLQSVVFPVIMANAYYNISATGECDDSNNNVSIVGVSNLTPTGFFMQSNIINNSSQSIGSNNSLKYWRVSGFRVS